MDFEEFKKKALLREPSLQVDSPLVQQNFEYALNQESLIDEFLPPFLANSYIFNLALHYCILSDTGELHKKYFPEDPTNSNILSVVGSASNATSSLSNMQYKGLADLSIGEALLTGTPYGVMALNIQNSIQHGVFVC